MGCPLSAKEVSTFLQIDRDNSFDKFIEYHITSINVDGVPLLPDAVCALLQLTATAPDKAVGAHLSGLACHLSILSMSASSEQARRILRVSVHGIRETNQLLLSWWFLTWSR